MSWGVRALVIVFALCIVLLGWKPLQHEAGKAWKYTVQKAESMGLALKKETSSRARLSTDVSTPVVVTTSAAADEAAGSAKAKNLPKKNLDRLTKKDRNQLDRLLQGLNREEKTGEDGF